MRSPLEAAGIKGSEKHGLNVSFMVFGIGTEEYVAINGKSAELSRILLEHTGSRYDKKTLAPDEAWELGEGYNLTVRSLEVRDNPRRALLSLSHHGTVLKEDWIPAGSLDILSLDRMILQESKKEIEWAFSGSLMSSLILFQWKTTLISI